MPLWLAIVLGAHLVNALAFLADKFLLARAVPHPAAYAFFVGLLGAGAIVLLPFGFVVPTPAEAILDVAAGATFIAALCCFFAALQRGEASRVVPYVGGTIPVWTLTLAYLVLGERLAPRELAAFVVLVLGAALIARGGAPRAARARSPYGLASFAAVLFAGSTVLMKVVFTQQAFIPGFVWSRAGALLAALAILLHAPSRHAILTPSERPRGRMLGLFLAGQLAGAVGFLALQYAVSVTSPTLVNALQGVQYAFLFGLTLALGRQYPQLRETLTRRIVAQRVLAIALLALGLALLARG